MKRQKEEKSSSETGEKQNECVGSAVPRTTRQSEGREGDGEKPWHSLWHKKRF